MEKEENGLDRIELIARLLEQCSITARAVTGFLDNPRKYSVDDSLYMREVHFVVALGEKDHPTVGEMAEYKGVTPGAVTQMVSRLEKKGYVTRSKSFHDKRQTTLTLTAKGRTLCAEHIAYDKREHQEASEGLLKEFSNEELEKFIYYEQLIRKLFTKEK